MEMLKFAHNVSSFNAISKLKPLKCAFALKVWVNYKVVYNVKYLDHIKSIFLHIVTHVDINKNIQSTYYKTETLLKQVHLQS